MLPLHENHHAQSDRMFGYHSKLSEKSTQRYGRDAMTWPLRHLGKALILIAKGFFNPGSARTGAWASQDDSYGVDLFSKAIEDVAHPVETHDVRRG